MVCFVEAEATPWDCITASSILACGHFADVNKDGVPDLVLNNEGQESAVLLGRATQPDVTQVGRAP